MTRHAQSRDALCGLCAAVARLRLVRSDTAQCTATFGLLLLHHLPGLLGTFGSEVARHG